MEVPLCRHRESEGTGIVRSTGADYPSKASKPCCAERVQESEAWGSCGNEKTKEPIEEMLKIAQMCHIGKCLTIGGNDLCFTE